jgi:predicted phosphodiesterase/transposase-like protein
MCRGDSLPDQWWQDKELLAAECAAHGTPREVSLAHGVAANTLSKWRSRHGLPKLLPGPTAKAEFVQRHDDAWLLEALRKRKNNATVEQLADLGDVSPRKVREALERLGHDGFRVAEEEGQRVLLRKVPPPSDNVHKMLFAGETVRFGVVSDTHLGSKHERLEELHHAYNVFRDEGITDVFHPGDLVCGYGIFPGQANEVHVHTYAEQVEYAVANYPKVDGIRTRIISGNHDIEGDFGRVGANPVVAFCNQRDDFEFLGDYRASIELEQGTRIYMLHPKGGMGYAADYKVRKLAEGFESGAKPNVMLIGHFHRRFDVEARGIHALLCGCFESGGSFGVRLGLSDPAVGFHIVEMTVADDGSVVKWRPEWHRFWPGRGVAKAA